MLSGQWLVEGPAWEMDIHTGVLALGWGQGRKPTFIGQTAGGMNSGLKMEGQESIGRTSSSSSGACSVTRVHRRVIRSISQLRTDLKMSSLFMMLESLKSWFLLSDFMWISRLLLGFNTCISLSCYKKVSLIQKQKALLSDSVLTRANTFISEVFSSSCFQRKCTVEV